MSYYVGFMYVVRLEKYHLRKPRYIPRWHFGELSCPGSQIKILYTGVRTCITTPGSYLWTGFHFAVRVWFLIGLRESTLKLESQCLLRQSDTTPSLEIPVHRPSGTLGKCSLVLTIFSLVLCVFTLYRTPILVCFSASLFLLSKVGVTGGKRVRVLRTDVKLRTQTHWRIIFTWCREKKCSRSNSSKDWERWFTKGRFPVEVVAYRVHTLRPTRFRLSGPVTSVRTGTGVRRHRLPQE